MSRRAALALVFVSALSGCDIDRPWPRLEPSLERMMVQPRVSAYSESEFFADGVSMRPLPSFTMPYEHPRERADPRDHPLSRRDLTAERLDGIQHVPLEVDKKLVALGQRRFQTICAACHGVLGDGRSPVADRMSLRRPPSLHDQRIRDFSAGHLYGIIRNGFGLMPSYAPALDERSRWAVVAYVEALQLSRNARASDVPSEVRAVLNGAVP